jgi:glutamyl/glutaminyl-tRNA synthetase
VRPSRRRGSVGTRETPTAPAERNLRPLPPATRTRFAPAPTGYLHLGHVANAVWVWGVARLAGSGVVFRIEDHDRQRSRASFAAALADDLAWLGFVPDEGPVTQSEPEAHAAYRRALEALAARGLTYHCACTRATFAAWARAHHAEWSGPGCPGACRTRVLSGDAVTSLRLAIGDGAEPFDDLRLGPQAGPVAGNGDLVVRDRAGNWTYGFAVVVDDLRQGVDLVIRGEDLLAETPRQIRLAALLGRTTAPRFLHHPLIRKPAGEKLSKADHDTGVRELRSAGVSAGDVIGEAVRLGSIPPLVADAARGRRDEP